jgi:hypothetical protein
LIARLESDGYQPHLERQQKAQPEGHLLRHAIILPQHPPRSTPATVPTTLKSPSDVLEGLFLFWLSRTLWGEFSFKAAQAMDEAGKFDRLTPQINSCTV